jgi:hypothetical protein
MCAFSVGRGAFSGGGERLQRRPSLIADYRCKWDSRPPPLMALVQKAVTSGLKWFTK